MPRTDPGGPDQLIPYVLVQVAARLNRRAVLGALILEPLIPAAAFLWPTGDYVEREFPSEEIRAAVRDAKDADTGGVIPKGSWLDGIAQAFDTHWGEMTVVEIGQYEVPAGTDATEPRRARLEGALRHI